MNSTTGTNLQITAFAESRHDFTTRETHVSWDVPMFVRFSARFVDMAEAEAFLANFPKSAGLRVGSLGGDPEHTACLSGEVKLAKDGVNGGRNETGIKRYWSVLRSAEKAGITVEWGSERSLNGYKAEQREAFEAIIGK